MAKFIFVFIFALGLGILVGLLLSNKTTLETLKDVNPIKLSCSYNGKIYAHGDSVPSGDSCNSCGCQNGQVSCTLMACDDPLR